jgi:hypothetical protein
MKLIWVYQRIDKSVRFGYKHLMNDKWSMTSLWGGCKYGTKIVELGSTTSDWTINKYSKTREESIVVFPTCFFLCFGFFVFFFVFCLFLFIFLFYVFPHIFFVFSPHIVLGFTFFFSQDCLFLLFLVFCFFLCFFKLSLLIFFNIDLVENLVLYFFL